jgi:hypothetical protein
MMNLPSTALFALVISSVLLTSIQAWEKDSVAAARTAERKVEHIEQNGASEHPDPAPTQISELEVNAFLASGSVEFPAGVQSLKLEGDAGNVIGRARVDFDKVRAGARNPNPLLSLFSGVHDVVITAQAQGSHGQGVVRVQQVWFDGTEIPRFVVQMFAEKYLTPRYPGIGMDSTFKLPARIDSAVVGQHVVTVVQK